MSRRQLLLTVAIWLAFLPVAHCIGWPDTVPCQPGTHRADTTFDRIFFTHTCEVDKP